MKICWNPDCISFPVSGAIRSFPFIVTGACVCALCLLLGRTEYGRGLCFHLCMRVLIPKIDLNCTSFILNIVHICRLHY